MKKKIYYQHSLIIALLAITSCKKVDPITNLLTNANKIAANGQVMGLQTSTAPSGYTLAYEENFNNNLLNPSAWYYRESEKYAGGFNKKENVSVVTEDGIGYLKIAYANNTDWNNDGANDISSGGVISTKTFGYGYYEARIKFYNGSLGLHESFWAHGMGISTPETKGTEYKEAAKNDLVPTDNKLIEIDGIELDSYMNYGKTNFWFNRKPCNCASESTSSAFNRFDQSYMNLNDWITVGFEWLPNTVIYYIDGVERYRFTHTSPGYTATHAWLTALANEKWSTGGQPLPNSSMKVDYFRFYNKPLSANMVGNYSFEYGGVASEEVIGWVVDDGIYNNSTTDGSRVVYDGTALEGQAYLQQDGKSGGAALTTKHLLNYIPNGTYRLSAWIKKTAGMTTAKMRALNTGSTEKSIDIPTTSSWTKVTIDNIVVSNNQADIGFTTTGGNGESLKVDKIELYDRRFNIPDEWGILVSDMGPGYSEAGTWSNSSLPGYQNSSSRYSSASGQYAQWKPTIPSTGSYKVYIYKIVSANSDPNAKINITHAGGVTTKYVNYTTGSSGWVDLGTYNFNQGIQGYVRTYFNSSGSYARADAAYFTLPANGPPN